MQIKWPLEGERPNSIPSPNIMNLQDVYGEVFPWYWVPKSAVSRRLVKYDNNGQEIWKWNHRWLLGFRDVCSSTLERTFVISFLPENCASGHTITMLYPECSVIDIVILQSMMSSLVFDYVSRQKIGGNHATISILKQMPVIAPDSILNNERNIIIRNVVKLNYFNHDLDCWAEDLWNELSDEQKLDLPQLGSKEPFVYDPDKRAILQAELDAIFAHLYGLSTEDLRYILYPEDVCGAGCINETFRVLKDNEIREFGEYRTKRLVMDAWYRFEYNENN